MPARAATAMAERLSVLLLSGSFDRAHYALVDREHGRRAGSAGDAVRDAGGDQGPARRGWARPPRLGRPAAVGRAGRAGCRRRGGARRAQPRARRGRFRGAAPGLRGTRGRDHGLRDGAARPRSASAGAARQTCRSARAGSRRCSVWAGRSSCSEQRFAIEIFTNWPYARSTCARGRPELGEGPL